MQDVEGLKDYVCLDTRAQCPQIMSSLSIDAAAHSTQINPVSPPAYMQHFLHLDTLLLFLFHLPLSLPLYLNILENVQSPDARARTHARSLARSRAHLHKPPWFFTPALLVLSSSLLCPLPPSAFLFPHLHPPSHSLSFGFFYLNVSTRYTLTPSTITAFPLHPIFNPPPADTHTALHSLHYLSRKLHFQHSQGPIMNRERHAVTFLKSH